MGLLTRVFSRDELVRIAKRQRSGRPDSSLPYVEAYPVLNIVHAARADRQGYNGVVWYRPDGEAIGAAEFQWPTPDRIRLNYRFGSLSEWSTEGVLDISVERKGSMDHNGRPLARCPGCGQSRNALVLHQRTWRCRRCHGLRYRSAMIGTPVRRAEKARRLRGELDYLRSGFFPPRRIARKEAELAAAVAKLMGPEHATAHEGLAYCVTARWIIGSPLEIMF